MFTSTRWHVPIRAAIERGRAILKLLARMTSNGFVVGLDVTAHEAGYDAYRGLKSFPRIEAEKNLLRELQRKQQEFYYEVRKGKVHFTDEARVRQKISLKRLAGFLRDAPSLVLLTTPLIWFCAVPIVLLDLIITIYQMICFPIYGIPKVRRADFILLDRRRLAYLNLIDKLNCQYCGYANGVFAYVTEVAARTE